MISSSSVPTRPTVNEPPLKKSMSAPPPVTPLTPTTEGGQTPATTSQQHVESNESFVQRFVPDMVVERLFQGGAIQAQELSIYSQSVVGFFDVSGFSSLARDLEQADKTRSEKALKKRSASSYFAQHSISGKGAEELVRQLNETLSALIETIRAAGGDIIKFAGDAILVVWLCEEANLESQLLRAADCALACTMLKSDQSKLGLHVGIGCGELVACHVGGTFGRWEFFIAGEACTQSALAEHHAGVNQVVLSPPARKIVSQSKYLTSIEGDVLDEDFYLLQKIGYKTLGEPPRSKYSLSSDPTTAKMAEGYVPGPVRDALKSGGSSSASVGGLRKLTVIFFKLYDVVLPEKFDEESKQKFLQQCQNQAKLVQDSAYHYYATLRQFILDDKGFVAIVALGLPPYFHEDNAVRAVKVAKRLIEHHKVRATAGICTGTVFCGVVGSSKRAEYSVAGSCINLAARLMAKAQIGTIWCDTITKTEAENIGHVQFQQFPSLPFKGFDQPVDIYGPIMNLESTSPRTVANNVIGAGGDGLHPVPESMTSVTSKKSSNNNLAIAREDSGFFGRKRRTIRHELSSSAKKHNVTVVGLENEIQSLSKAVFLAPQSAKICFIEGEAGSGKTRLVEWVQKESLAQRIFLSTADSSETNTPFFVWRTILQNILAINRQQSGSFLLKTQTSKLSREVTGRKRGYSNDETDSTKAHHRTQLSNSDMLSSLTQIKDSTTSLHRRTFSNSSADSPLKKERKQKEFDIDLPTIATIIDSNDNKEDGDEDDDSSDGEVTAFGDRNQKSDGSNNNNTGGANPSTRPIIPRPPSNPTRFSMETPSPSRVLSPGFSHNSFLPDHPTVLENLRDAGKLRGRRISTLHVILPNLILPSDLDSDVVIATAPPPSSSLFAGLSTPLRRTSLTSKGFNNALTQQPSTSSQTTNVGGNPGKEEKDSNNDTAASMEMMLLLIEECGLLGTTQIIIENAQFMDKQSWELLRKVVEFNPISWKGENRVRFVVTYRPFPTLRDHPLQVILQGPVQQQQAPSTISSSVTPPNSQIGSTTSTGAKTVSSQQPVTNEKVSVPPTFERVVSSTLQAPFHFRRRSIEITNMQNLQQQHQGARSITSEGGPTEFSSFEEMQQIPQAIRFTIPPFTLREAGVFLSNFLHVAVGPNLLSFLFFKSKGNPRALLDCFKALQDQDLIKIDPTSGTVEETTCLEDIGDMVFVIPLHLRAQLQQQFDKLLNREQLIVKLASVIGSTIPISLLKYLYQQRVSMASPQISDVPNNNNNSGGASMENSSDFEFGLKELKDRNFLSPFLPHEVKERDVSSAAEVVPAFVPIQDDEDWVFESDYVRFLVYSQMLHTARREIHGLVLDWYESRTSTVRIREDPSILGNHAVGAERLNGLRRVILKEEPIAKGIRLWQSCTDLLEDVGTGFSTDMIHALKISIDLFMGQVCLVNESWIEANHYLTRAVEMADLYFPIPVTKTNSLGCFPFHLLFNYERKKKKPQSSTLSNNPGLGKYYNEFNDPLLIVEIDPKEQGMKKAELARTLLKKLKDCQESYAREVHALKKFSLKETKA